MEPGNRDGAPPQSIHRTARYSNVRRVHLPPVAVSEEKNLQNFFPLPRREEEEEALELEGGANDDEL